MLFVGMLLVGLCCFIALFILLNINSHRTWWMKLGGLIPAKWGYKVQLNNLNLLIIGLCICLSYHGVLLKSFILKTHEVRSYAHPKYLWFYFRVSTPTPWTSHLTWTVFFTKLLSEWALKVLMSIFPTALERSASPILRECSINCWGDPWQQRSSNQPPSLSTSLTHSHKHIPSDSTHSPLIELEYTEEESQLTTPVEKFRYQGDRPGASQLAESSSTSAPGDSRQDPHLGPLKTAAFFNRHDGSSLRLWGLK